MECGDGLMKLDGGLLQPVSCEHVYNARFCIKQIGLWPNICVLLSFSLFFVFEVKYFTSYYAVSCADHEINSSKRQTSWSYFAQYRNDTRNRPALFYLFTCYSNNFLQIYIVLITIFYTYFTIYVSISKTFISS